jgi:hypothetical protein
VSFFFFSFTSVTNAEIALVQQNKLSKNNIVNKVKINGGILKTHTVIFGIPCATNQLYILLTMLATIELIIATEMFMTTNVLTVRDGFSTGSLQYKKTRVILYSVRIV